MGRPPLAVGTFGKIDFLTVKRGHVRARARYRDYDGVVRSITRYGRSRPRAESNLREALRDRVTPTSGQIDQESQERPRTTAGWRSIALPRGTVQLLLRRRGISAPAPTDVVFPGPLGQVRDRSNTTGDLRRAFDRAGFEWVSPHTLRKTVATRLDDAGLSARQIADRLGHARPSLTQDVYLGRKVVTSKAAQALEF